MLKTGDFFVVKHGGFTPDGIVWFSKLMSKDNDASYCHAGIITDDDGGTFEALWPRYTRQNFYAAYNGYEVLVGRHIDMTPERFSIGFQAVQKWEGKLYPFLRFGVFMLPYLAKYIHTGRPVCSECNWLIAETAGLKDMTYPWGRTPDDMADAINRWDVMDVIYNGIL